MLSVLLGAASVLPAYAARVVVDETGRKVTVPDRARRIVCLTPSVTDTVFALGAGDQVAAITDFTAYPPAALKKPSIGNILRPSLERIATMHPDLVIAIATLNDPETIRGLEHMGVPVFLVNQSGITGLYRSVESIGQAIGRPSEARVLVASLRQREARVRREAERLPHPSVFFAVSVAPCITAGHGAFLTELLTAAGARVVTDNMPQEWINISLESILPKRPQYILLLKDSPVTLKELQMRPGWRDMEAVRTGRVLRIDDRLQYPSPVAFDALENFARQLHEAR
ncbi:MAG: helical backbone metal receptor [Acidobacteriota bacterium]|nr:helical backbone metal receptor [Acidobacteriota bacterium]